VSKSGFVGLTPGALLSLTGIAGGDFSCFGGNGSGALAEIPGTWFRGGTWFAGTGAGVFAVLADFYQADTYPDFGFRCARWSSRA
jgi:hypothetical protein